MLGPYQTNKDGTISYRGNNLFPPIKNINSTKISINELESRVKQFDENKMWTKIAKINHKINISTNYFFDDRKNIKRVEKSALSDFMGCQRKIIVSKSGIRIKDRDDSINEISFKDIDSVINYLQKN